MAPSIAVLLPFPESSYQGVSAVGTAEPGSSGPAGKHTPSHRALVRYLNSLAFLVWVEKEFGLMLLWL